MRGRVQARPGAAAIVLVLATAGWAFGQTGDDQPSDDRAREQQTLEQTLETRFTQTGLANLGENQTQVQEQLRLDAAIVERLQAVREEDLTLAEEDEHGRRLAPIDWEAVRRDWSSQIERDRSSWTSAQGYAQRPPTPEIMNVYPEDMQRPSLPMLVPRLTQARTMSADHERSAAGMLVFPHQHFYTCSMHVGDHAVSVTGSRIITREMNDARTVRGFSAGRDGEGVRILPTRYGMEMTFTRYGAAYSVEVLCEQPQNDGPCVAPERMREIYRRLALAGGSPNGEGDSR